MRKLFIVLLFCPFILIAQKIVPRFENDTVFTSSGYKIYVGQTLHFGKGSAPDGKFRFVRFIGVCCEQENLTDNTVKVLKLSKYNISGLGNGYIRIRGSIVFPDGEEGKIDFNMAFDKVIEGMGSIPSEMIVPAEFRSKPKMGVSDEIAKLYKLYQDSILTKEEFELQKKKLLTQ